MPPPRATSPCHARDRPNQGKAPLPAPCHCCGRREVIARSSHARPLEHEGERARIRPCLRGGNCVARARSAPGRAVGGPSLAAASRAGHRETSPCLRERPGATARSLSLSLPLPPSLSLPRRIRALVGVLSLTPPLPIPFLFRPAPRERRDARRKRTLRSGLRDTCLARYAEPSAIGIAEEEGQRKRARGRRARRGEERRGREDESWRHAKILPCAPPSYARRLSLCVPPHARVPPDYSRAAQ